MKFLKHPSSFRDPSGFIFVQDEVIYRNINKIYKNNYDKLMLSGLYNALTEENFLIPHTEIDIFDIKNWSDTYKVIRPEPLSFISYPYEWCFNQLKDAALLTLDIQIKSLEFNMILKDASAYNIQFMNGKPVFIDTLSFEPYSEGKPWIAYRQFCQHFLAPLSLMKYRDIRYNQMLKAYLDGIPLDFASSQLPIRSLFIPSLFYHIHLHSKYQQSFAGKSIKSSSKKISRFGLLGIIDSLKSAIKKLEWKIPFTEWGDYYNDTNYSQEAFDHKKNIVEKYLEYMNPNLVFDLGANTGEFSRLASKKGIQTIAFDVDPVAVEKNYKSCINDGETRIIPLLLDLTNPSSGIGWDHKERSTLIDRGPADLIMGLALIHHLAISNNLPFINIASYFAKLGKSLIIEFIPKEDSQVKRLLATREDIFPEYNQDSFERDFKNYFEIIDERKIENSQRILYLMKGL